MMHVVTINEDEAFKALEDAVSNGDQDDQIVYFDDYDMVCNYDINESEASL